MSSITVQCEYCKETVRDDGKFVLVYDGDPVESHIFCSTYCIAAYLATRLVVVMKDATKDLGKLKSLLGVE